ncbi:CPBP family intramembrane glutamic endopeptidase [Serratia marcescens]|uniref:CPBP family intramembrane glutamic endopeptidase n=1 Tax=Serratia marcescens TaxID=615 RepID=UPI003A8453C5
MNKSRFAFTLACFAMVLLMVGLTFYPWFLSDNAAFVQTGLMLPVLYLLEFGLIVPLYVAFFSKEHGMGMGKINGRLMIAFTVFILLLQYLGAYILGIRKAESWMTEQEAVRGCVFWVNTLLLVFLVPIYEEMVFRGCLFSGLLQIFKGNIYWSALTTSAVFAILHTQYSDIRTFMILALVSLLLIAARIVSRGVAMPVLLHMLMNGFIMATSYYLS